DTVYRADYSGDYQHLFASTTGVLPETPRTTATGVSCSNNPIPVGFASTCTATVTDTSPPGPAVPSAPPGTGTFTAATGAGTLVHGGTCRLIAGTCKVTFRPSALGDARIEVAYDSGRANGVYYVPSGASTNLAVVPTPAGAAHYFSTGAEQT